MADGPKPPNLLLIVVDQERRWQDLPKQFPFETELPHRAALQRGAADFTSFNISSTPCGPARGTLYTGTHFQKHGLYANDFDLPKELPTIGTMLRENGYATVYKGKWHMNFPFLARNDILGPAVNAKLLEANGGSLPSRWDALEPFGFSEWDEAGDFWGVSQEGFEQDSRFAAETASWLQGRGRELADLGQPWFLAVNFINPHDIMFFKASEAQEASRNPEMLPPVPFRGPPDDELYEARWGCLPAHFPDEVLPAPVEASRRFIERRYGRMASPEEHEANVDYYLNCLRDVDRRLGTVLEALESAGLAESTAVVFTADHGEMLGDHGLRQKGAFLYRQNIGVPFLVRGPGVKSGLRTGAAAAACTLDVAPTLLGLAGVQNWRERYPQLKGQDLSPLCFDSSASMARGADGGATLFQFADFRAAPHEGVDAPGAVRGFLQGVITERYKFGRFLSPGPQPLPDTWELLETQCDLLLYDVELDPDERVNLALQDSHRSLVVRLNEQLNALLEREIEGDLAPWSFV